MPGSAHNKLWPELPYEAWKDTRETLHLWTQIAGEIRLALTPWLNHSWHVPLYVTACGLSTSPIPYAEGIFEIQFDFNEHLIRSSPVTVARDASRFSRAASPSSTSLSCGI